MPPRTIYAIVFFVSLALWTVALLVPVPDQSAKDMLGSWDLVYVVHKIFHVSAYSYLTVIGGLMAATTRQRLGVLLLLSFHGFATEFLQQFVNRGASIIDVGFDHIGILLGVLAGWSRWKPLWSRASIGPEPAAAVKM